MQNKGITLSNCVYNLGLRRGLIIIIIIIIIITLKIIKIIKTLSVAVLVAYMEKQKSRLRKLKRGYWRRKKQEDARRMNAQFELDPGRVYSGG